MPSDTAPPPLPTRAVAIRLAAIGLVLAAVALAFAATAGWLSPQRLTARRLIDTFESNDGVHPGFRRNHAKGVCIAGSFDGNGAGSALSTAQVFAVGRTPVLGRFALAGGQPYAADAAHTVRSMALRFLQADGQEWRTGMNDIPVFVVRTPADFEAQLLASRPDPATGKPDPAAFKAFLDAHPETVRAIAAIKSHPGSSGFGDDRYESLDAFRFVDANGVASTVRWAMVPMATSVVESADAAARSDKNYLFDDLVAAVAKAPLQWRLQVTVADASDPSDDATAAWPAGRRQLDVGILTIDRVIGEGDAGGCRDLNFDPLVLPTGIEASDDPLLSARSAAYAQSYRRRAGESATPSAVTTGAPR